MNASIDILLLLGKVKKKEKMYNIDTYRSQSFSIYLNRENYFTRTGQVYTELTAKHIRFYKLSAVDWKCCAYKKRIICQYS